MVLGHISCYYSETSEICVQSAVGRVALWVMQDNILPQVMSLESASIWMEILQRKKEMWVWGQKEVSKWLEATLATTSITYQIFADKWPQTMSLEPCDVTGVSICWGVRKK